MVEILQGAMTAMGIQKAFTLNKYIQFNYLQHFSYYFTNARSQNYFYLCVPCTMPSQAMCIQYSWIARCTWIRMQFEYKKCDDFNQFTWLVYANKFQWIFYTQLKAYKLSFWLDLKRIVCWCGFDVMKIQFHMRCEVSNWMERCI